MFARNSATDPGPVELADGCDTYAVVGIGGARDDSYERPGPGFSPPNPTPYEPAFPSYAAAAAGRSIGPGMSSSGGGASTPITASRRFSVR